MSKTTIHDTSMVPDQNINGEAGTKWKIIQDHPWASGMVLIAMLLSVVYFPSLFSPAFIVHEDSILHQPLLSSAKNIPIIFSRDFLIFSSGQYLPASYATLALVRTFIPEDNLLFWHGWLLLFHAVNALLVFALLRNLSNRLIVSFVAAAVFCIHPLATVVVNDINQFGMILGTTLNLGTILTYITFVRKRKKQNYFLSLFLYCMALFTVRQTLGIGLILLGFEILSERTRIKTALLRIIPFAVIPLFLSPLLFMSSPHPLYYKYIPAGSFWYGFFSVTGATGTIINGLTLTLALPIVLHDTVERIFSYTSPRFLLWIFVNCSLVAISVWAVIRKQRFMFGLLMMYLALIPYASVTLNQVENYISWIYFYLPLAGFAWLITGLAERLGTLNNRFLKRSVPIGLLIILIFWGGKTIQLNTVGKAPLAYWNYVYSKGVASKRISQTALNERGKVFLSQNKLPDALQCFFSPANKDYKEGCLALSRYYCQQKENLASAIHFRFGAGAKESGLVLQEKLETGAMLLSAAGALDYAEDQIGQILMANPYHTGAMAALSDIWLQKGNILEAKRFTDRIKKINSSDSHLLPLLQTLNKYEKDVLSGKEIASITQPPSDWIEFAIQHKRSPTIRQQIIELSRRADPQDAVIQLEAMQSFLEEGKREEAAGKAQTIFNELNNSSSACAAVCDVLTKIGNIESAIKAGSRAVQLDKTSKTAWQHLTEAYALKGELNEKDRSFVESIKKNPALASSFYYNLGLQKSRKGNDVEAVSLFEKAIQSQPSNLSAYKALAKSAGTIKNPTHAVEILNRSLSIKRDDPEIYHTLAINYMNLSQWEQSIQTFQTAIKLDPENHLFHYNLAIVLKRLNRLDEALVEFRRTSELKPDFLEADSQVGSCLIRTGKTDEALTLYKKIALLNPNSPHIHANLGVVYMMRQELDQAIPEFEEEIRRYPDYPVPYQNIIQIHLERNQIDQAKFVMDRAQNNNVQFDKKFIQKVKRILNE